MLIDLYSSGVPSFQFSLLPFSQFGPIIKPSSRNITRLHANLNKKEQEPLIDLERYKATNSQQRHSVYLRPNKPLINGWYSLFRSQPCTAKCSGSRISAFPYGQCYTGALKMLASGEANVRNKLKYFPPRLECRPVAWVCGIQECNLNL